MFKYALLLSVKYSFFFILSLTFSFCTFLQLLNHLKKKLLHYVLSKHLVNIFSKF